MYHFTGGTPPTITIPSAQTVTTTFTTPGTYSAYVEGRGATTAEAAAWVDYCNGSATSKQGALRKANGEESADNGVTSNAIEMGFT